MIKPVKYSQTDLELIKLIRCELLKHDVDRALTIAKNIFDGARSEGFEFTQVKESARWTRW